MKKPEGVVVIAVYYMVVALFFLVLTCGSLMVLAGVAGFMTDAVSLTISVLIIGLVALVCLVALLASVVAASGLLALKNWGRWSAIVLGVLQLPVLIPVSTAIGGLIIYYLLRDDVRVAFDTVATPVTPERALAPGAPAVPEPHAPTGVAVAGAADDVLTSAGYSVADESPVSPVNGSGDTEKPA